MSVTQVTKISQLDINRSIIRYGDNYIHHQNIDPQRHINAVSSKKRVNASRYRICSYGAPGTVAMNEGDTDSDIGSAGINGSYYNLQTAFMMYLDLSWL